MKKETITVEELVDRYIKEHPEEAPNRDALIAHSKRISPGGKFTRDIPATPPAEETPRAE